MNEYLEKAKELDRARDMGDAMIVDQLATQLEVMWWNLSEEDREKVGIERGGS